MLKTSVIFFLLVCINCECYSQSYQVSVSEYYKVVNKAEICIIQDKIDSAISIYENLVKANKSLQSKDYFNLAVCYALKHRTPQSLSVLKILINRGAKVSWLISNPAISKAISEENKDTLLECEKMWTKNSYPLNDTLSSIYSKDQKPRQGIDPYKNNLSEIKASDSINVAIMNRVIKSYGFIPGEEQVGINDPSLISQPFYILFVHQTPTFGIHNYSSVILESIKKGSINPYIGAYLYFRTAGSLYNFGPITLLKIYAFADSVDNIKKSDPKFLKEYESQFPWLVPALSDFTEKKYDSIRAIYGLEPLKDFYSKVNFLRHNENFRFYYAPFLYSVFQFANQSDADNFKRRYIELEKLIK